MVLLSFTFHMNVLLLLCAYYEQWRFVCKLCLHFSLSCCACVFALLHSRIACHKLFGINLREINKCALPCFSWLCSQFISYTCPMLQSCNTTGHIFVQEMVVQSVGGVDRQ